MYISVARGNNNILFSWLSECCRGEKTLQYDDKWKIEYLQMCRLNQEKWKHPSTRSSLPKHIWVIANSSTDRFYYHLPQLIYSVSFTSLLQRPPTHLWVQSSCTNHNTHVREDLDFLPHVLGLFVMRVREKLRGGPAQSPNNPANPDLCGSEWGLLIN